MGLQQGIPARDAGYQNIQYLRKRMTFDGAGQGAVGTSAAFVIGRLPAGAIIQPQASGVDVTTVFNAATNNRLNVGIAGTPAKYGAVLSLLALGFVPCAVAVGHRLLVDTDILITPDVTGTAATTGDCDVLIAYILAN